MMICRWTRSFRTQGRSKVAARIRLCRWRAGGAEDGNEVVTGRVWCGLRDSCLGYGPGFVLCMAVGRAETCPAERGIRFEEHTR